jgi:hypothetical protein
MIHICALRRVFNHWKRVVDERRYDMWSETHDETLKEAYFARENDMDTIYWCWNCKHSDCDIHA